MTCSRYLALVVLLTMPPTVFATISNGWYTASGSTSLEFTTDNADLQRLHDRGMKLLTGNRVEFAPGVTILVEGGGYNNAWLETQPMGGEMYARHDLQVALNNQTLFMRTQREDGRLPGMVVAGAAVEQYGWQEKGFPEGYVWRPDLGMAPDFEMFQGFCFPEPAWRMTFWAGLDRAYLEELYRTLEAFDAYLWRTRDSNGDGLLETWCVWDTGEDGSTRLHRRGFKENWPYEHAPHSGHPGLPELPEDSLAPFQSMDVMAYSYSGRVVLAKIAERLGNGREDVWRTAANKVRQRVIDRIWDPERNACFDRDRYGKVLPELIHNNLRCMWYGLFTQEMADAFIRHHLLNPDGFWTPVPLVSMPVNEPLYLSRPRNNWSGQPQGLTYQRAIHALERYGHFAEITLLGRKLLPVLIRNDFKFSQQMDPFTGVPSLSNSDGYGPMILAMQEYVARMHGVTLDVERGEVWWSMLPDGGSGHTHTQQWNDRRFQLNVAQGTATARINGKEVFTAERGMRVVTDLEGQLLRVVGIDPEPRTVRIKQNATHWTDSIQPNQQLQFDGAKLTPLSQAPFDYPYQP